MKTTPMKYVNFSLQKDVYRDKEKEKEITHENYF